MLRKIVDRLEREIIDLRTELRHFKQSVRNHKHCEKCGRVISDKVGGYVKYRSYKLGICEICMVKAMEQHIKEIEKDIKKGGK